ncbi:MAG TPA: NAD(P)/FAD-dependent oxidoreductase [Longimicrobiales bacterium]
MVVVGGGPAGSMTAMLLARAGYEVTLLERQHFPRAKPCGDCLSPGANPVLKRLGVWDDVVHARPARLTGWQLTSPGHISFQAYFSDITNDSEVTAALAISRDRLDSVLLDHARKAGVDVQQGVHVTNVLRSPDGRVEGVIFQGVDRGNRVKARLTVGADGLRSVIARRLNAHVRRPRLRKASFTMHIDLPTSSDNLGVMRIARDACLGIAQVDSHALTHNVTLVLNHGSYDARAGVRSIVAAGLKRFGLELPDADTEILTSGPFDWPSRQSVFDGAALVGDAAGYYDPFTGQGIFQALRSAELLGECASAALRTGNVRRTDLLRFEHAQRRILKPARGLQRIVEFVCARPQLADRIFGKFQRDPVLAEALIGVTSDLLPVARLLSPRLLARLAA